MSSEYLQNLYAECREAGERYLQKIKLLGDLDPFTLEDNDLDFSMDAIPPVGNMDIVCYLVLTYEFYTPEQMKDCKNSQSYKYFEDGCIEKLGTKTINDFCILVGKVKHSQIASSNTHDVWIVIGKEGIIHTAHCTCMTGCTEVCSHVGAILFAAERATIIKQAAMSCTDVNSAWSRRSTTNLPAVPVSEMDFGQTCLIEEEKEIPAMTSSEIKTLLKKIESSGGDAVLMRIVEPFATRICEETCKSVPSLLNIFDETNMLKNYRDLLAMSKAMDISVKEKDFSIIEQGTRRRNDNPNWLRQTSGRLLDSKFKLACKTNKKQAPLSLIQSICYPTEELFHSKPALWTALHKQTAIEDYKKYMGETHECFVARKVGLVVCKKWPQFAASPDRLVACKCHLRGCVEIKCPHLLHANNIRDIKEYVCKKNTCLTVENGRITLSKTHAYYYQVQMQIFVTKTLYCDFVIWSPNLVFMERIFPDEDFLSKNCKAALKFHSEIIMPELLGKYFTRNVGNNRIYWCVCREVDDGSPMIKCDKDECETRWFHFRCVMLEDIPNEPWFCDNCRKVL